MSNGWSEAILINSKFLTKKIKSLTFSIKDWKAHKPGQYYDLRKSSNSPSRSFSVVSSSENKGVLEFAIELLDNGKVSPDLFELKIGETIEVKGPLGNFTWEPWKQKNRELFLISGGNGVTPFVSFLRNHYENFSPLKISLLISAKDIEEVPYKEELENYSKKDNNIKVLYAFTKSSRNLGGVPGRINQKILEEILKDLDKPHIYISGSTSFVDQIFSELIKLGINYNSIFRERFGPNIY